VHCFVDPRPETEAWQIERIEGGVRVLGRLRTADATAFVASLHATLAGTKDPLIDLSPVEQLDGGVVALIREELRPPRGKVAHVRFSDRFEPLEELYCGKCPPAPSTRPEGVVAHVGRATVQEAHQFVNIVAFTGRMAVAARRLVAMPRLGNLGELPELVERAGADAVPIVLLITYLVGFVLAYMAARSLQTFGVTIFVADIVGIGMTRQLGPLMTAIIICGRSGAAYTTELGGMKVDNEIDAMRTMGLDAHAWLVMPRLLALVLVTPILILLGDVMGIVGGLVVAQTSLGISSRAYLNEVRANLTPWDVESGLILGLAFSIAIGLIACEQGFAASGGPQGVGRRATATVVTSLFAIVLLDAGITVLYRLVGLP
jgi:phospholipid/cholesterol/gamma-HCH transport system permease protein